MSVNPIVPKRVFNSNEESARAAFSSVRDRGILKRKSIVKLVGGKFMSIQPDRTMQPAPARVSVPGEDPRRYAFMSPEHGMVEKRFTVMVIFNSSGLAPFPFSEIHPIAAVTAKEAAMIARDRFSKRDYEVIKVEDPKTRKVTWYDRDTLEHFTGKEGMV